MGQIIDPEGRVCEKIKWHSRQKHAFLEAFLNIWSEQVGKDGKSNPPTLDIFDLYASSGWCHCPEEKKTWMGSALLAAECLRKYQSGRLLFLNTFGKDQDETIAQKKALDKSLIKLQLPKRINYLIETLPIDKAVDIAINNVKPNFPNLWILDPYKPQDLPWNIVEKICKLEGSYKKGKYSLIRRPELFINLMTSTLQKDTGNENLKEDWVGLSLGMKKEEWKSKLECYLERGKNTREALIFMYAEKLSNFYRKPPIILEVPSTYGNIVYTVFLCTDHDAGHYVMKLHKLQKYLEWHKIEWEKSAETISEKSKERRKDEKLGLKPRFLDEFEGDRKEV
jgi:three-Cys-motif partner protein